MNVTIIDVDGSEGFIVPPEVMASLDLKCGDTLELREIAGGFQLRKQQEAPDDVADAIKLAMKMARTALDEIRK